MMYQAHRIEKIIPADKKVVLTELPFTPGEKVEILILGRPSAEDTPHTLHEQSATYHSPVHDAVQIRPTSTITSQPGDTDWQAYIHTDFAVLGGKPIFRGTRVTVELVLEKLAAGETIEQLLEAHPRLTHEAILAGLAFAAATLRADVVYPLPAPA